MPLIEDLSSKYIALLIDEPGGVGPDYWKVFVGTAVIEKSAIQLVTKNGPIIIKNHDVAEISLPPDELQRKIPQVEFSLKLFDGSYLSNLKEPDTIIFNDIASLRDDVIPQKQRCLISNLLWIFRKPRVALTLFIFLGFSTFVFLTLSAIKEGRIPEKNWIATEATVSDIYSYRGGQSRYGPTQPYTSIKAFYSVEGKRIEAKFKGPGGYSKSSGEKITIYRHPRNPKKAGLTPNEHFSFKQLLLLFLGIAFIAVGLILGEE